MSKPLRAGDELIIPNSRFLIGKSLSPKCLLGLHEGTLFVSKVLKPVDLIIRRNNELSTSIYDADTYDVFLRHSNNTVTSIGIQSAYTTSEWMKFALKETQFSKPTGKCISKEDYESILEDVGGTLNGCRCKAPSPKKSSVKIVRKPVRKPAVKRQTRK